MSKKIIIISGKQFCGKDTLAKLIRETYPNFKRIGLGDAIKIEYGEQKGLTFEEIEQNKPMYRADLQALGNLRRTQDVDYWIKKTISLPDDIIVPDVRVQREYDYFKSANAFKIRVNASKEVRSKRGTLAAENDITETALDQITDWDLVINNNGTYEELIENSQKALTEIKEYFAL